MCCLKLRAEKGEEEWRNGEVDDDDDALFCVNACYSCPRNLFLILHPTPPFFSLLGYLRSAMSIQEAEYVTSKIFTEVFLVTLLPLFERILLHWHKQQWPALASLGVQDANVIVGDDDDDDGDGDGDDSVRLDLIDSAVRDDRPEWCSAQDPVWVCRLAYLAKHVINPDPARCKKGPLDIFRLYSAWKACQDIRTASIETYDCFLQTVVYIFSHPGLVHHACILRNDWSSHNTHSTLANMHSEWFILLLVRIYYEQVPKGLERERERVKRRKGGERERTGERMIIKKSIWFFLSLCLCFFFFSSFSPSHSVV